MKKSSRKSAKSLSIKSAPSIVREISWLTFNDRVLDEAADPAVPILERVKFLGIYSSNLDEFFRIRVATLNRLRMATDKKTIAMIGHDPTQTLKKVHEIVLVQQRKFERIYQDLLKVLGREKIYIVNEQQLTPSQGAFVKEYFDRVVRPKLFPIMIDPQIEFPELKDASIYLLVDLYHRKKRGPAHYAFIEVPTSSVLSRFLILPNVDDKKFIMLLDDVIRYNLGTIFSALNYDAYQAYTVKVTRDAELDIENDIFESYIRKIHKSVKQRKEGQPVRLVYDSDMPRLLLKTIIKNLGLKKSDPIIAGGRYHNFKDFTRFPDVGRRQLRYMTSAPFSHPQLSAHRSILDTVLERDILLHFPYHSFDHCIDLLREASINPKVTSIKITLYRAAHNSSVVNALMTAVKNGKSVVAVVELQARFDEEANIHWANELQDVGAKVVFGNPGIKVHAKLCLITMSSHGAETHVAAIGTGNFNEDTGKLYTDHLLLTKQKKIAGEVASMFEFLENSFRTPHYKRLIAAPFSMRKAFIKLIQHEIDNAALGKEAYMLLKLNHLTDNEMIGHLYRASQAGVKIRLIVRGMFTLSPGIKGLSDNIEAIRIIDRFLEHARVLIFANGGDEKCFISSGDWMPRNLDRRIEVACPILDNALQRELKYILELQWRDNAKSTRHDGGKNVRRRPRGLSPRYRAQSDIHEYLRLKH